MSFDDWGVEDWLLCHSHYLLRNNLHWRICDYRAKNYLRSLVIKNWRGILWLHKCPLRRSINSRWARIDLSLSRDLNTRVVARLLETIERSLIDWRRAMR